MKVIGITGGVGAGKSEILDYISRNYNSRIILADEVAHQVKEPGEICYKPLIELLTEEILNEDGSINKQRMAEKIFSSEELLAQVNEIIHPAVVKAIVDDMNESKKSGCFDFFFVEAALLIETGFDKICDELWYIYTNENVRRERLKASRGYSDEKINGIIASQLPEETFRKYCKVVIDNSGNLTDSKKQVDEILEAYLCQT